MKKIVALVAVFAFVLNASAQTAESFYNEGLALKKDLKSADAISKFKRATELQKDYAAALYEMGWCMNDTKDYTGALSALRKARPLWPDIPKVYFELGYAFSKLNLPDSAVISFNKCLELKSDYSGAYKELGNISYTKEKYPEALNYYANYISNAPSEIKDYLFWYRKGFCENAEKKYTEAITSLEKSLLYKTDYNNTYLELGFAYNKLKQGDEAIKQYNKAINIDAKSHIPYNGIAEVYRDTKKDIDQAMSWYQQALNMKTDERKACFGMGYCMNSKARYADAIPYLKKAIQQENTYTAAYVELGYSYYMTFDNSNALTQLSKALELNPKNENARYYSGLVYISQKNRSKAQQMVDELRAMSSKNAETLQGKVNAM